MNLLSNLRLSAKLTLIGAIALVLMAVPFTLYSKRVLEAINATSAEIAGLDPSQRMLDLIRLTQQHRGLSGNVLAGNQALEARRLELLGEVNTRFKALATLIASDIDNERIRADWRKTETLWQSVSQAVGERKVSATESVAQHSAVVSQLIDLHDRVLDHSGLTLDPEADAYFLIISGLQQLPRLADALGQARGSGSMLLTRKSASSEERLALSGMGDRAASLAREIDTTMQKSFEAQPPFRQALGEGISRLHTDVDALSLQMREKIVTPTNLEWSSAEFFDNATKLIDNVYVLTGEAGKQLGIHLAARKASQIREAIGVIASVIVLTLLGCWVVALIGRSILHSAHAAQEAAKRIASGDLSGNIIAPSRDELGRMLDTMREMQGWLARTVTDVRRNADGVASASAQIAQGNTDLSRRNEQQAAALEETSASMEQMGSTVAANADNAKRAQRLAADASEVAGRGGEAVSSVVATMRQMNETSRKISEIITVIDGIAFQTNILALNAAVEAARAGDQGRGFAVVAGEVRNLAQRSAEAAREVKTLITATVEQVERGTTVADQAGSTMAEVVDAVNKVSTMMTEISTASNEQSMGIGQVGQAISQLDQTTQQNAALVEEAAAAAESLRQQAAQLVATVQTFKLGWSSGQGG